MKIHKSLETLPLHNWIMLGNTNNLLWLSTTEPKSFIQLNPIKFAYFKNTMGKKELLLHKVFRALQRQIPDGVMETNLELAKIEFAISASKANLHFAKTGKKSPHYERRKNEAKTRLDNIRKAHADNKSIDINEVIVSVERLLGLKIDPKAESVAKWFAYLKTAKKISKENEVQEMRR